MALNSNTRTNERFQELARLERQASRQKLLLTRLEGLTELKERLISPGTLEEKVQLITQGVVSVFNADFARIWLLGPGDKCGSGCFHAPFTEGPHACVDRKECLHLVSSSGRYTQINGIRNRVPVGCYKVGQIAAGALPEILSNSVTTDPRIQDHAWAKELGLISFFGHRLISKDGETIGVLALFSQKEILDDDLSLLKSLSVTATHVIQTLRTEAALRENETRLRKVFDNMQDCFYQADSDGTILWVSPSTLKLLGFCMEEVIGKDLPTLTYYHPEDRKLFLDALAKTGRVTDFEVKLKHKNGRPIWVSTNSSYFRDAEGNIAGVEGSFRDITERRTHLQELARHRAHLEELVLERTRALAEREQQYRALFENAGNAVLVIAGDHVVDCNAKAEEYFGCSRETLLNVPPADLSAPVQYSGEETRALGAQYAQRALQGEHLFFEWKCRKQDGRLFDVEVSLNRVDIKGQKHLLATFTDITRRKQAEAERMMLTRIMESTSDMVSFSTPDKKITYMNAAGKQMLGLEPDDPMDDYPIQQAHPKWAFDLLRTQGIPEAVSRGVWSGETALLSSDGQEIPISQVIMGHNNPDGDLEWISTIVRDISQIKQAQKEMKNLQDLLANIIDSMPSALIGVDSQCRITQWNKSARKNAGKTFEQVRGKHLSDIFPQFSDLVELVKQSIAEKRVIDENKIHSRVGEKTVIWNMTVYPLAMDAFEGAVIRLDDVTERLRLEEMMIQSEKMLSVGGLAAGMAHEINNPLAGIIQNVQVLEKRMGTELPANHEIALRCGTTMEAIDLYLETRDLKRVMMAIKESGGRAATIVNNMLDFSRKGESAFLHQDLGEMMDQTLELASSDYDLRKQYDFRQIQIIRDYQGAMPMVRCERTKIQQVLLNLLQNAAQAMHGPNRPSEAPQITIRVFTEKNMACISVKDNGVGMDQKVRKRVFEPFFTTKELGVGTGLGLSVSYFIITENHNGAMHAESAPGKGATFTIRLPLDKVLSP